VELRAFFAASRLMIVAGKGGVGKTTVSAVLARAAAETGLRVLVVAVGGGTGLGPLLGAPGELGDEETRCQAGRGPRGTGEVRARTVTPAHALDEYLDAHGMRRLTGRLMRAGVLDIVATAAPGIDDILVLGRVKALARDEDVDLVVLDAPAAGHAVTFLQSARGLVDAVSGGPIHTQAREVLEMLGDPARCQVVLVTLPEETPVNELVDTAFTLEDRVGVSLGPIVVNGAYADHPGLDADLGGLAGASDLAPDDRAALLAAAAFRLERVATQSEQTARLAATLPLAQIVLPYVFAAGLDAANIEDLVTHLLAGIEALP
jgi:hypothetical protein